MAPDAKMKHKTRKTEGCTRPHTTTQNTREARNSKEFRAKSVAGAEGFEPSARGFGVDVEKASADIHRPISRAVEPFVFPRHPRQKILMIY